MPRILVGWSPPLYGATEATFERAARVIEIVIEIVLVVYKITSILCSFKLSQATSVVPA